MSYAEKRSGKLTGVWIAERVLAGSRLRQRCATKAEADRWEAYVDATGAAPLDGTGARVLHSLGKVAKQARAEREATPLSRSANLLGHASEAYGA